MQRKPNFLLKALILEKYGSQLNFALTIKESEIKISRVIRGSKVLQPEEKESWARALGVNVGEVFD